MIFAWAPLNNWLPCLCEVLAVLYCFVRAAAVLAACCVILCPLVTQPRTFAVYFAGCLVNICSI